MSDLRSRVIRLAYARPDLRPALLPLLKEAAYPRTEVKFRDRTGTLWSGIAQDIAAIMIVSDVPKNLRDRIMTSLLAGESPRFPDQALKELKRRGTIRKVVTTPAPEAPQGPSLAVARKKLDALMKAWAKDARKDWMSDNPGSDVSDVARDLALGFLYQYGVAELIAAAGMRKNLVVDMVAEQLAG